MSKYNLGCSQYKMNKALKAQRLNSNLKMKPSRRITYRFHSTGPHQSHYRVFQGRVKIRGEVRESHP